MMDPDSSESFGLRGSGGWGAKKQIGDRLIAIAKMAYEILVWVLVLRTWFLCGLRRYRTRPRLSTRTGFKDPVLTLSFLDPTMPRASAS